MLTRGRENYIKIEEPFYTHTHTHTHTHKEIEEPLPSKEYR